LGGQKLRLIMKSGYIISIVIASGILLFTSCDEYLDKTPDAVVSEKDIFSTYESFQGFIDANYAEILTYNHHYRTTSADFGGDVYSYVTWASGWLGNDGEYWYIAGGPDTGHSSNDPSLFNSDMDNSWWGPNTNSGIWAGGWRGIRVCNVALDNLHLLSEATEEERRLLEGQIYFFRAFFHAEIISAYGGMPYVDVAFAPDDDMNLPRINYQACTEKIVEDYDRAIELLPEDWDQTSRGSQSPGTNTGRITKGAALAYKQKALLYAASPLMNKFSGNDDSYNIALCERAAAAGWEMIQLARKGVYSLVPFSNYSDNFYKTDGTMPWTSETVMQRVDDRYGQWDFISHVGLLYAPSDAGAGQGCETVNQLFIDRFEMADGSRYKTEYDYDETKRWENRDPRFRQNIILDREKYGFHDRTLLNLYVGDGSSKTIVNSIALPYLIKKFWPKGVNKYDQMWTQFRFTSPRMRLAEVYLDYAEAVTVAYGPAGSPPGASLTAVDALNVIRERAGMPPVTAEATGYPDFMELVRNERNVELCFEGHFWWDIRRWYVAHLPEYKDIVDLSFDKDYTYFNRSVFLVRNFENPKHYWLPLPRNLVRLYESMYQNPGWE
jgi:hypothetical protein